MPARLRLGKNWTELDKSTQLLGCRALLIIVLITPNFYSAGPQASHRLDHVTWSACVSVSSDHERKPDPILLFFFRRISRSMLCFFIYTLSADVAYYRPRPQVGQCPVLTCC